MYFRNFGDHISRLRLLNTLILGLIFRLGWNGLLLQDLLYDFYYHPLFIFQVVNFFSSFYLFIYIWNLELVWWCCHAMWVLRMLPSSLRIWVILRWLLGHAIGDLRLKHVPSRSPSKGKNCHSREFCYLLVPFQNSCFEIKNFNSLRELRFRNKFFYFFIITIDFVRRWSSIIFFYISFFKSPHSHKIILSELILQFNFSIYFEWIIDTLE